MEILNKRYEKSQNELIRNLFILFTLINVFIALLLNSQKEDGVNDIHLKQTGFALLSISCYYYIISGIFEKNVQKLKLVWLYLLVYFIVTLSQIPMDKADHKVYVFLLLGFYVFAAIFIYYSVKDKYQYFHRFFIAEYGISSELKSKFIYN